VSHQALQNAVSPDKVIAWSSELSSAPSRTPEGLLVTLFNALDKNEIRYCVLHSWEELPQKLSSDLDLAVHPDDARKLPLVFRALEEKGYTAVQVFNYFVGAYYFVFSWIEVTRVNCVAIDLILEHRRGGLVVPSGPSLVSGRRRHGLFWIPAPESEFTYLLAKKTWKGGAPVRQELRLKALVEQLGRPTAERLAGQLFLGELRTDVVEACASGRIDAILGKLRGQTWKTSLSRNPWKLTAYLLTDGIRRARRWMQPTGVFVTVMGPDGAGKSTLIQHLIQAVGPAFRRNRTFHWRPMLLWRPKVRRDTTSPHSLPAHPSWWSVARLFAYLLDYWLGYWLLVRPRLARSGLVVFDRYFDDLLIDAKRYRYGKPLWLVRALSSLMPKPDLVLVLDAPAEVVLSRKQEVEPEEVRRQRRLYSQYQNQIPHSRLMDATASVEQVTAESARVILEFLAERYQRRFARRPIPRPT
jgi:thymidylate kinase